MIAVYFRPDRTQVLSASIQKDKTFAVESYQEYDAALSYLTETGSAGLPNLGRFLEMLKKHTDIGSDDVYIVLPDFLFSYVDCIQYINEDNLATIIEEHTGEPMKNFYVVSPVSTKSPAPDRKSIYALKKQYIDRLVKASMQERVAIVSVEPASFSFFRAYGQWQQEMPVVEIFPDRASIVTYSPAGGIFLSDSPSLTEKHLTENNLNANMDVSSTYAANDYTAGQTYTNMNTDMPYIVLSDNPQILRIGAIHIRLPKELSLPDFIHTDLPKSQQGLWMPVIGTLLQAYDDDKTLINNPVYINKKSFITITNGNLLPAEAQDAVKKRQWKRIIQRGCRVLSTGLLAALVVEVGTIAYFSSITIPASLQSDYRQAKKDLSEIQSEISIIDESKNEDQNVVGAFSKLVVNRPDGCGFTTVEIGSKNPESLKGGTNDKYVQLTAVAQNELSLQDFQVRLSNEPAFSNATINSINADAHGLKTAKFTIGRGSK